MMRSMTGFGKAQAVIDGIACNLEARCVNGRYLELSVRMPKDWQDKEGVLRETVREHVSRGSLNIYIRSEDTSSVSKVGFDADLAAAYLKALAEAREKFALPGEVHLTDLLQLPAIFQPPANTEERPDVWPALKAAIIELLENLNEMRMREGNELMRDLKQRLDAISAGMVVIKQKSIERIPLERARLQERVSQILAEEVIDQNRLTLEITLLADKLDVTEECVRLASHIEYFVQAAEGKEAAGRKLNFLLQEMNREINTIGSKSNDSEIAQIVIGMKEELERMREQVQNIE